MSATKKQILYVNSALRNSGSPSDFKVILGNDVLRARKGYRTSLAVGEATINRSWYNVKSGSNVLILNSTTLTIPPGNYNALDLRVALASVLPLGWSVTYDRLTSRYTINTNGTITTFVLGFQRMGRILGFPDFSTVTLSMGNPSATSTQAARVNGENSIFVRADLTKSGGAILDNTVNRDAFNDSTTIAKIPIDVAPFDNIVYRVQNDLEFFELPQGHTDAIRIWLTDDSGVPLDVAFDWTLTLVVSHEPEESSSMLEAMQETRDLLKLVVLSDKRVLA